MTTGAPRISAKAVASSPLRGKAAGAGCVVVAASAAIDTAGCVDVRLAYAHKMLNIRVVDRKFSP